MRERSLGSRLFPLLTVFIVLFFATAFYVWRTLETVKVSGPLYSKISQGKDLIADVLPPPVFVIEAMLQAESLRSITDPNKANRLIEQGITSRAAFETRIEFWRANLPEGEIKRSLIGPVYSHAIEFFRIRDEQFIPALRAANSEAMEAAIAQMIIKYESHLAAVNEVVKLSVQSNDSYEKAAIAQIEQSQQISLLLGFLTMAAVLALTFVAFQTSRKLSGRIALASSVAERIAGGDLSTEVPEVADNDESASLLRGIAQMNRSLRALVSKAKQSSIELMSAATEYAATSRSQENAVQGFGASTHQIGAAVKQINATSTELLRTMGGVAQTADQTATSAEQGQSGLTQLNRTMDALAGTANQMASRLSAIRSEASEITSVVTTISKVADQTNLLSINAAIEAEKAGEQGLGFLVLAREIRRLADQTAVATVDIDSMVKKMQTAVSAGVMEIDRFSEEVKNGVGNVNKIGTQFGQIITQIRSLSERFETVNEGMRAQAQGASQIGDAIGTLMDGARQTSISLQEFNSATGSLRDAVQVLKSEISQFNVGSHT